MNDTVTVALAQLDLVVGDVRGNTARINEYSERARDELDADLVVFPELSLCGYPPEDLLSHSGLRRRVDEALEIIRTRVNGIAVLIGFPEYAGDDIWNACAVFSDGKELARYSIVLGIKIPNVVREVYSQAMTSGERGSMILGNNRGIDS